jgi:hypothetical protein
MGFARPLKSRARYLSLAVLRSRQARNAAAACSRSSALLSLRRGCFGGRSRTSGILPLISSTPCRRIRLRLLIRDQLTRAVMAISLSLNRYQHKAATIRLGLNHAHAPCFPLLGSCAGETRFDNPIWDGNPHAPTLKLNSCPKAAMSRTQQTTGPRGQLPLSGATEALRRQRVSFEGKAEVGICPQTHIDRTPGFTNPLRL